jgi:hypothetical protein
MIEGSHVSSQFTAFKRRHLSLILSPRTVPGASALAFGLLAVAWTLPRFPVADPNVAQAPLIAKAPTAVPNPYGAMLVDLRSRARSSAATLESRAAPQSKPLPLAAVASAPVVVAAPVLRLSENAPPIDLPLPPRRSEQLGSSPRQAPTILKLGENASTEAPLPPARPEELRAEAVAPPAPPVATAENVAPTPPVPQLGANAAVDAPLPPRRPDELNESASVAPPPVRLSAREAAPRRGRGRNTRVAVAPPPVDDRSFFEKLFGIQRSSSPALGYAPTDGGVTTAARSVVARANPARGYDQYTAIYDISAHTVYLPNGARLEAHSGLGARLDDPRYVHEKMRGATPPTVYALTPREELFHGVRALRLTPLGGNVYGRAGLLAHTFMLGPNGDSNGCVSFRNYQAFLQAYQNGEVRRLAVVASLN